MNKRVLIVDNDAEFLETRADGLAAQGYHVERAASLEQAEAILDQQWVHVAIVDLRMRDDSDDKDSSGLALVEQAAYRSIPKIVLTRWPTFEYVREALGPDLSGLSPAVAFIAKQEGLAAMIQAVEQAFALHVRVNWRLTITWTALASFHQLVNLLDAGAALHAPPDRAGELEDLLRKLFYDNTQITIGRVFVQQPGRVILEVFAYGDEGAEGQFVVSCGQRRCVEQELALHGKHAPKWTDAGSTERVKTTATSHFAAIAYRLIGCDLEDVTTFRSFYQRASAPEVVATLDRLFRATLAPWHRKSRSHEAAGALRGLYLGWLGMSEAELAPETLAQRVAAIGREALAVGLAQIDISPHTLVLGLPDDTVVSYATPAAFVAARLSAGAPVVCGIAHGGVDADTVLVDGGGQTWLIDFAMSGRRPLLCDSVLLETAIALDLLETADLAARHALEQRLLNSSGLNEPIGAEGLAPDLQVALSAVERVRYLAAATIGRDMAAYLLGLLACALKRLLLYDPAVRYTRRQLVPYVHSLLRAAMLYDRLAAPVRRAVQPAEEAGYGLWIDAANQEVWVEGRLIELTPQDFKILAYLYQRTGQLCTRETLVQHVLDDPGEPGAAGARRLSMADEASRLNTAMGRLRQKIEPDPDRPRYIITVRGRGYKLLR